MVRSVIYAIVNSVTGKIYVGSAIHYPTRWTNHKSDLVCGRHCNRKLQNAWNKYGEEAFQFKILEPVWNKSLLLQREQYWIDRLDVFRNGYNMCPTAGSALGRKQSEATKQKLREINTTPEFRAAHSRRHKGKIVSEETRKKQAAAKQGRKHSEETKKKMREARSRFLSSDKAEAYRQTLSDKASEQWERQREQNKH